MNENNFKDNLKRDNVEIDKKNILPNLGADKQRLEVEKIHKIISDVIDGNFDKFETDEDVYNALQNINAQDARLVLKACADTLGINCNADALNKLNKSRIVALFFEAFGVYPEKNPPIEPPEHSLPTQPDDALKEIFPDFQGAVDLEFNAVKKLLPAQFQSVNSIDALKETLSAEKIPEGRIVRDFVEGAITTAGISCDLTRLKSLTREKYLPLLFQVINFKFAKSATPTKPTPPVNQPTENISVGFAHFEALFKAAKKISASELGFDIAGELKVFEGNPVTVKDGFFFAVPENSPILRGLVGIATLDGNIAAIGHIEDGIVASRVLPHAVFEWSMIRPKAFQNRKHFLAVLIPQAEKSFFEKPMSKSLAESYTGEVWTLEFTLNYTALERTDRPLCIDFGTSNTTVGTYDLDKAGYPPELVTFRDVSSSEIVDREILPTIVYVESCRDGIVNYKHGYEAKKEIINAGYDTKASVFYEIKRWINSLDTVEEVTDKNGNFAQVTRGEILREYLMYVIRAAEQQYKVKFTNLHMTAPVKLRNKFIKEMQKILGKEYSIDEKGLDEGVAIVYHYIAEQIKTAGDKRGKLLILDCGGGTTDLSSCNFEIEKNPDWDVLKIDTDFENGDSNFGGNNITYRILQMLKMKIVANILRSENLRVYDLIPEEDDEILSQIDYAYENKDLIYEQFENEYARAEEVVPTKFAECPFANERRKIKRNFYYLWQMAEAIKIEFFKSNLVNVDFEKDKKIYAKDLEQYYLSIRRDGKMERLDNPMENVEVTIREVGRIILPDLYALLKTLLNQYGENELTTYKYHLSGQSCKINQFRDLFKEFIPGNLMRVPTARTVKRDENVLVKPTDSVVLKKYCILGSIEYVRDAKALGQYKPIIRYKPNRRIYEINIVAAETEQTLLGRTDELQIKKFPGSTSVVMFVVRDANKHIERRIKCELDKSNDVKGFSLGQVIDIMVKETARSQEEAPRLREKLEDSIGVELQDIELPTYDGKRRHSVMCIAALESAESYGFNVYQIYVRPEENGGVKYWMPNKRKFYSYEDERLQTFFNGDK